MNTGHNILDFLDDQGKNMFRGITGVLSCLKKAQEKRHERKEKEKTIMELLEEANKLIESDPTSGYKFLKQADDIYQNLGYEKQNLVLQIKGTFFSYFIKYV